MIPTSAVFNQSTLAALLSHDPLIAEYRAFFALFDCSIVEQWQAQRSSRGRPPHLESAYLKAFLIRIREGLLYIGQLRRFLLHHPLLVLELGFQLHLNPQAAYRIHPALQPPKPSQPAARLCQLGIDPAFQTLTGGSQVIHL